MNIRKIIIIVSVVFLFLPGMLLVSNTVSGQAEPKKHVVEAIDNYFSLSLKYDISIDDLKKANPGITNPKPGDVLIIPAKGERLDNKPKTYTSRPGQGRRDTYRVALMIPFYTEQLEDTNWRYGLDPSKINELAPFRFVQFYHGFMLAADSLRKSGLNVEIYVYDVDHQTYKMEQVLQKPEMKKMDLIVGPFLKSTFPAAAEFARENGICIINPLTSRSDILTGNPYVFKLLPSLESQPVLVGDLVRRDFSDYKVILYIPSKIQDTELIAHYKQAIEQADPAGKRKVTVIDYATDSIQGFKNYASLSQPNLIIIFSENEVLPAALLNKLNSMESTYDMSVIGLPEWDKLTNIELDYLMTLNAHIFMASYIDYRSDAVKGFVQDYRMKYLDEPLSYAFSGFDAGYYFLSALFNYGKDFENHLDEIDVPLIQNQFHFERSGDGGYDNLNWNILYYYDYSLYRKYSY